MEISLTHNFYADAKKLYERRGATMTHKTKTEFYKQYGMTMADMGRRVGVSKECIRIRFKNGKKVDGPKNIKGAGAGRKAETYEGKTIREWAKELNVPIGQMYYRIREHNDPRFKTRHFVWTKNQHKNADKNL
jgi:hypothetical protein